MQFDTAIEKFHPTLQPLLREFARKSHALNLIVVGSLHQVHPDTLDKINCLKVNFYDPRFAHKGRSGSWEHQPVGSLQVTSEPDGDHFIVASRLIKNEKFKRGSSEYKTKTSKSTVKVIKTMLDNLKPYTYTEIFNFHTNRMRDVVGSWRGEHYNVVSKAFSDFINRRAVYEEIKHLRDLGVQFKTKEFQDLAMEGVDAYEEHIKREKQKLIKYHVFVEDKRVAVTACEETAETYNNTLPRHLYSCESIDKLADDVIAEVSLLKMLDVGKDLVGVGVRVSERDYLVIKPLASATNA